MKLVIFSSQLQRWDFITVSLDVPNESIMEMVSSEKASPMGFNKWEKYCCMA